MVLTKAFNLVNTHLDPNQLYGITWYLAYYCVWCGVARAIHIQAAEMLAQNSQTFW